MGKYGGGAINEQGKIWEWALAKRWGWGKISGNVA